MKVVIATDSFKGRLSTIQAGKAIFEGIKSICSLDEAINSKTHIKVLQILQN